MKAYGLAADVHFHSWSSFATTTSAGINSRLAGLISELHRLCTETRTAGGDTVVLAGDVFHVRGSVAPSVLNPVRDAIEQEVAFGDGSMKFVILAGNHDLEGKEASRIGSAITALEQRGVKVVNEPIYHTGIGAVLVPWIENIETLKATLSEWSSSVTDASELDLIIHAPIDGVIEGLPPHGLTPGWLAGLGFKRVFAGHYHNHKNFRVLTPFEAPGEPGFGHREHVVTSIGALAHHTWSDVGSRAGFLIVHDTEVKWLKSHLPEFVDLARLTELEPDEVGYAVDGNYVRVKVESAKVKDVQQAVEELKALGALAVIVQATPAAPLRERADGAVVSATGPRASLESAIGSFIGSMKALEHPAEVTSEALSVLSVADELVEA